MVPTLGSYPLSFGRLLDLALDIYYLGTDLGYLVKFGTFLRSFFDAIYIVAGPYE